MKRLIKYFPLVPTVYKNRKQRPVKIFPAAQTHPRHGPHCLDHLTRPNWQTSASQHAAKMHDIFGKVTLCHITLFYYVGWSYLMMRRYVDAIKTFSNILFYIGETKPEPR